MKDLDLSALVLARLAWLIARQNGAWESLAEADAKLRVLSQSRGQIGNLERFKESTDEELLTARDKA